MKPTVINLINIGDRYLRRAGLITHSISSERLLEFVLKESGESVPTVNTAVYGIPGLYLDRSLMVERGKRRKFFAYLRKRAKRFPLQYLIGEASFMDFAFAVDRSCLIPRPETELLIEHVLRELLKEIPSGEARIIDIGTGCGNIALSLSRYLPFAEVWATDVSKKALSLAKANAVRLGLKTDRFILGDLFGGIPNVRFECVVSNPPYLSESDMKALEGEVLFEPRDALLGGEKGTETIVRIAEESRARLTDRGLLAFEIGMGQAKSVRMCLRRLGYSSIKTIADYAGIQRVVLARFRRKRKITNPQSS